MSSIKYMGAQRATLTGAGYTELVGVWGKAPTVLNATVTWTNAFSTAKAKLDAYWAEGAIPSIDWFTSLSSAPATNLCNPAIIAGGQDAYITAFAQAVKADGRPLFLFFCSEMNGSWYPAFSDYCNGLNGTFNAGNFAGSYRQMYERVRGIFASVGVTNVTWGVVPNIIGTGGATGSQPASQFYSTLYPPDLWGCDGFNYSATPWGSGSGWYDPAAVFHTVGGGLKDTLAELVAAANPGQRLCIGSTACNAFQDSTTNPSWATNPILDGGPNFKGGWFKKLLLTQLQAGGGVWDLVDLVRYYDTDGNSVDPPYTNGFSCNGDGTVETPTATATAGVVCAGQTYTYAFQSAGQQKTQWQAGYNSSLWLDQARLPVSAASLGVRPPVPYVALPYDAAQILGAPSNMILEARWTDAIANNAACIDSSGNGFNGAYHGTTMAQISALAHNATEKGFTSDGTDYAEFAHQALFSQIANAAPLWVQIWFQVSAWPTAGRWTLAALAGAANYEWETSLGNNVINWFAYPLNAGATYGATYNSALALNTPHCLDCVYDPAHSQLGFYFLIYADGVRVGGSTANAAGLGAGTGPLRVGLRGDGSNPAGTIANPISFSGMRVRSMVPTPAQVSTLYAASRPAVPVVSGGLPSISPHRARALGVGAGI